MIIRHCSSLLLLSVLLAALATSLVSANPSTRPEDGDLFKGQSLDMYFYENQFFSFSMTIPGDWHVDVGEDLRQLIMKCSRRDPSMKLLLEGKNANLLSISKYPPIITPHNCNILILAHDLSAMPPVKTGKDFLDHGEGLARISGQQVIKGVHPVPLGGERFHRLDTFSQDSGNLESTIARVIKGYVLRFVMTASDQNQMDELDKILNSLDFQ